MTARRDTVPSRRSTADVRATIIEAAAGILARRGLEAATIKEVAKAAGISPGLIYHYFEDKGHLLAEVLRAASKKQQGQAVEFAIQALRDYDDRLPADAETERFRLYHRLRYELFVLGLRDPRLLPDLAALLEQDRRALRQAVETSGQRDVEGLSYLLLACFDDLALQRLADPSLDFGPAYDLIASILETDGGDTAGGDQGIAGKRAKHTRRERDSASTVACRKAWLGRTRARLRRNAASQWLLCFEEITNVPGAVEGVHRGRRAVPLGQIAGSVGRCSDFDRDFLPARESVGTRWKRMDRAFHRGEKLPPVSLYKIGVAYFGRPPPRPGVPLSRRRVDRRRGDGVQCSIRYPVAGGACTLRNHRGAEGAYATQRTTRERRSEDARDDDGFRGVEATS